ncbi:RpiR family transcriptional regulator, partial [Klebsiella pneumoniae]
INYINHLNLSESSIIVITSSESSPLGRLADIAISYNVLSEKIDDADVTTQIPAIYIIEKLAKSVRQMMIQDSEINREE